MIDIMNTNATVLGNSSENGDFYHGIERTSFLIRLLVLPVICFVGFVGNTMSVRIFVGRAQRTTSCCIYLAMKAVSDNGFLLTLLIAWLDFVNIRVFHIEGVCQIVLFLSYLCGFMSAWAVVLVTVENYIRVCCPKKVASICRADIARNMVITCFISACMIYNFPLWGTEISVLNGQAFCRTNPKFESLQVALIYVDSLLTLVVPLFIIPLLVLLTVCSSVEASRRSMRLLQRQSRSTNTRRKLSPHSAVTRLLLTVALVFMFLHTPSHIIRIKVTIEGLTGRARTASFMDRVLQQLFLTLYYLNYAVNIFIYVFCGRQFRTFLYNRLQRLKENHHKPQANSNASFEELIRISHSFLFGNDNVETAV